VYLTFTISGSKTDCSR